ncbi:hypothetical protein MITS9509_02447 [Synechococcus sp. MIT S9509]|nr:hypothetical protein MITS9504_02267 [Synechococcus sp. MIT S9504]KZR91511.1 hypothetical protein MITS9509_02447 [Synechococcus sp. MIT S9509]
MNKAWSLCVEAKSGEVMTVPLESTSRDKVAQSIYESEQTIEGGIAVPCKNSCQQFTTDPLTT